jgi:hypothetical protein
MTADDVLEGLEAMRSPSIKKMLICNHGVKEPCFGVKVGDMKTLVKPTVNAGVNPVRWSG